MQNQDIARNNLPSGDPLLNTIAYYKRTWTRQVSESIERLLSFLFLVKFYPHDHENKAEQHDAFLHITKKHIKRSAGNK